MIDGKSITDALADRDNSMTEIISNTSLYENMIIRLSPSGSRV